MAHSVVKVTDDELSDRLLLVVDPDGTITPDKETVQTYLSNKPEGTEFEVMHVNKINEGNVDLSVETYTYIQEEEEIVNAPTGSMDEIARNLYYLRMDHDYTPLTSPKATPTKEQSEPEYVDELAQTLSMLDGDQSEEEKSEIRTPQKTKKPNQIKSKIKVLNTYKAPLSKSTPKLLITKEKPKESVVGEEEAFEEENEQLNEDDDSDFEMENAKSTPRRRAKRNSRSYSTESKNQAKIAKKTVSPKLATPKEEVKSEITPEKKVTPQKKEKKAPKPILDDFALFSTPDIIRRVGGKTEPESPKPDVRPKVVAKRLSTDAKSPKSKELETSKKDVKERRQSADVKKTADTVSQQEGSVSIQEFHDTSGSNSSGLEQQLEPLPNSEDIRSIIGGTSAVFNTTPQDLNQLTDSLDLDQSILDNINTDLISEDILYQVAQSLADNTELQNAIDKTIVDGSLNLEPTLAEQQDSTNQDDINEPIKQIDNQAQGDGTKGTQIVRPDGRIVVIPPIERPTTRSRNKRNQEPEPKPVVKQTIKPLDEEHVSGNELDSESDKDDDDEEEDEDDPDKLWCICNQPHNNRFMICCDTCEEWYHGKCVNVTKAMGQMMENEGKEWICLFCKDSSLKRPAAAARRIRKASRTSTDSASSQRKSASNSTTSLTETKPSTPACIVCSKPSRVNSIFCSDECILKHAKGVEKVVVFERKTGKILSGTNAPSAANLDKWLREHPGFEVVRSTTSNKSNVKVMQSKLKLIKNVNDSGVSLAIQKKGINIGVLQHAPKERGAPIILNKHINNKKQMQITGLKIISKQLNSSQQPMKTKIIHALPINKPQITTAPKTPTTPTTTTTVVKVKPAHSTPKTITVVTKEKPAQPKIVRSKSSETPPAPPQPKQENIRENVRKTLFEQLTNRLKLVDDLKLSEEEVNNISTEIESQLYKCFGDTSQKYRNKYRSLIFNIKDVKNQTLWRRICEKSINPYQLVRLSPDDLASQELALWREETTKRQLDMIKKSELELLNCNRQYVFKTHKGEQVFEDDRPKETVDSTEVITGLAADAASDDSKSSKEKDKKGSKHSKRDRSRDRSKERDRSRDRRSSKDKDRRRKSWSKERDRHKRSHSHERAKQEKKRSRSRERDRHRRSSHKSSKHKKEGHNTTDKLDKKSKEILEQLVDKRIVAPLEDHNWKSNEAAQTKSPIAESESDHEPSSTVTIPTPPQSNEPDNEEPKTAPKSPIITKQSSKVEEEKVKRVVTPPSVKDDSSRSPTPKLLDPIWTGIINMVDVAQISITAHEVSGDCSGLGDELTSTLDIVGRIAPETVWEYIGKMKCSNSKMISLLRLHANNVEEQMPYIALYSYLSSRKRLGVVKSTNKAVKDFYILPLSNQKPIPQALLPINGPGFEESRPPLLLGIIVRDKRKRPAIENAYTVISKRLKTEQNAQKASTPPRSYTPPPSRDPRIKTSLPLPVTKKDDDMDEPYSPEDSDPENSIVPPTKVGSYLDTGLTTQILEPFTNKFETIPGLEDTSIPTTNQELQRKMAELDQKIAMEKAVIDNMSQDIASSAGAEIGASAFSNIALPSNLQQILDSIKTIGPNNVNNEVSQGESSDLTIPLMLPKISSRTQSGTSSKAETPSLSPTIPLNLPKIKSKPQPVMDVDKGVNSVLSSLTEEDLIRKAAEMLGENESNSKKDVQKKIKDVSYQPTPPPYISTLQNTTIFNQPPPINLNTPPPLLSTSTPLVVNTTTPPPPSLSTPPPSLNQTPAPPLKRSKIDLNQPPIPGLEDET